MNAKNKLIYFTRIYQKLFITYLVQIQSIQTYIVDAGYGQKKYNILYYVNGFGLADS